MNDFIHAIPKTELHIHIEGTLEPELMFSLADRNGIKLPYPNIDAVHAAYQFKDLESFLKVYYQGASVLIHEQDFYDLTWGYLQKVAQQNVRHVEIFFDPQTHTHRNISFNTVFTGIYHALQQGLKQFHITFKLIPCFLRDLSEQDAEETFKQMLPYKEHIVAVGLDSAEIGNPPEKFHHVFQKAIKHGFLTVAHAGEEGPPSYIWEALNLLNVKRIDHGVHCIQDNELVKHLAQKQIPLTVCPLSNVKLRVVDNLSDHPLKKMLDLGLCVTVNSDDPAYFGGYIEKNYLEIQKALNLTKKDIYQLAKNGINATFLTDDEKQALLIELEQVYSSFIK